MGIRLYLGHSREGTELFWDCTLMPLMNTHMFVSGKVGNGKTTFLKHCITQLPNQGVRVIIFDYPGDFQPFFDVLAANNDLPYHCYDVRTQVGIDPFQGVGSMKKDAQGSYDLAAQIVEMITTTYGKQGSKQQLGMKTMLEKYLDGQSSGWSFCDFIERSPENNMPIEKQSALFLRFREISKLLPARQESFCWELTSPGITLINFSSLPTEQSQTLATQFLLSELWSLKTQAGNTCCPLVVVLDECQRLNYAPGRICHRILREGRKYEFSGWFATQWIDPRNLDAINVLTQAGLQAYFSPDAAHVGPLAHMLSRGSISSEAYEKIIRRLDVGQFLYNDNSGRPIVCIVPNKSQH